MKLYELADDYLSLLELEDEVDITDTLEAIEGMFTDKATNIGYVLLNMDSDISAVDVEIKRLTARKRAMTNRKESLKDYLRTNMEKMELKKVECPVFNITMRAGRPVASITNEEALPAGYLVVKYSADKTSILADLKKGKEITGAELSKSKPSITVK